jgi:hypothetical protein
MKPLHNDDIFAMALALMAFEVADTPPFNYQRMRSSDRDVREVAQRIMAYPNNRREEALRDRALREAPTILHCMAELGWENTLRIDTPVTLRTTAAPDFTYGSREKNR